MSGRINARLFLPLAEFVAVLTIQHQMRDVETLIADLTSTFLAEGERLKRGV